MFFSSDTWEHTQKPLTIPKKLNKQTRKLMKKFSQISQLNEPNENTVSCVYYDLTHTLIWVGFVLRWGRGGL